VFTDLPQVPALDTEDTSPKDILDRRLIKKGNAAVPQVLIKWSGIPVTAATWEDLNVLKGRFPDALAWGQSNFRGGALVIAATTQEK
jgi:hypothetical protein